MTQRSSSLTVGLDVGGSSIKCGVVERSGGSVRVLASAQFATRSLHSIDDFVAQVVAVVRGFAAEFPAIAGVGIGFPACVDSGIVSAPPNIPWWSARQYPLRAALEERLGMSVAVDNDANVAALAECVMGWGRQFRSFLFVTLGTGVGGALVLDGLVYRGVRGTAGEIGHTIIDAHAAEAEPTYRTGVLERYVGREALIAMARAALLQHPDSLLARFGEKLDVIDIAHCAVEGDNVAREVLRRAAYYLGVGLASVLAVVGLDRVVIGGGMSALPELFYEEVRRTLRRRCLPALAESLAVERSLLGAEAGTIGAALLVE